MKRLTIVAILLWGSGICLAQDSRGEFQGVYLRIQGFTFNSGSAAFDIENASINGGGYVYVQHITEKFGLYQQMGFFWGAEQNGIKVRLVTEFQGMQVNKKAGPLILYAKGGLGFTRYLFSGAFSGASYGFALNYGGGTEIKIKEGLNLVLEATRLTMGLPNLTGVEGRSKWDNSWQLATGIAIHF
jgi:hypothetical protein